jgi:hypothetical protein
MEEHGAEAAPEAMSLERLLSVVVYAGLVIVLTGIILLIRRKRRGAVVFATGIAAVIVAMIVPPSRQRVQSRITLLDALMPEYEHMERHETLINASPDVVQRAIRETRAHEIRLFRLLTRIRGLGRQRRSSSERARPLLDVARSGNFADIGTDNRELVLGTIGQFWRLRPGGAQRRITSPEQFTSFAEPGYAKAAINFRITPEGAMTRVVTETRILTFDSSARRRFTAYWRVIYPGSALIRQEWLKAIKRRAEARLHTEPR